MIDGIALGPALNSIGVTAGCLILVALLISDKLVSGKRLRRVEAERDRWIEVAIESLGAAKVVVPAAEALHRIVAEATPPQPPEVPSRTEGAP